MQCASSPSFAVVDRLVKSLNATSPPVASLSSALPVLNQASTCAMGGSNVRRSLSKPHNQLYVIQVMRTCSHTLLRYLDALHFAIDGNYHFNQKAPKSDPNDFPMTRGGSYFIHDLDFKHFHAKAPQPPKEVS